MSSHRPAAFAVLLVLTAALLRIAPSIWAIVSTNAAHDSYLPIVRAGETLAATPSGTPVPMVTVTATATATNTAMPTGSNTPTAGNTATSTATSTPSNMPTATSTSTATGTATPTPTSTGPPIPSNSPTPSPTATEQSPPSPGTATLEEIAYGQPREKTGYSVSVDGDTAVIGAPYAYRDNSTEKGVTSIYTRSPDGSWVKAKELTAPDGGAGDNFGNRVAISGDLIAVSALSSDNTSLLQGIVYLFERNASGEDNWGLIKTVTAPDAAHSDLFGVSLDLQDDLLVVGSLHADHSSYTDAGAVYIFERNRGGSGNWGLAKKIVADDSRNWTRFGRTVALDGDILVANADIADDLEKSTTYIFQRDQGGPDNWGQVQKFTGSGAELGEHYGWSVALSGDLLTVGAYWATVGSNEKQGALYVFRAEDEARKEWTEVAILTAPDGQASEEFSRALTISDNLLIVGAPSAQVGDNQHQGAAYIFLPRNSDFSSWDMTMRIDADPVENGGQFAFSLGNSGDSLVLGWHSSIPEGTGRGAVYFYKMVKP